MSAATTVTRGPGAPVRTPEDEVERGPRVLSPVGRWCLVLGSSIIVLFAAMFVSGFLGLLVRVRPGWWVLVPAIAVQVGLTVLAARRLTGARAGWLVVTTLGICWLLILLTGAATQLTTDTSVDGRHYQSETTRAVAAHWNPERDGPLFPTDAPYQPDAAPKASAIVGATILNVTRSIDATRVYALMLLAAAGLVAIAGLEGAGAGRWLALGGGIVLAANPVALAQTGTAMVDGVVSSLLVAAIALMLLWVWRHPPLVVLPPFVAALALLVNTKFTGLVYVAIIVLPVLFVAGLLARRGRALVWMIGGVVLCALVAMLGLGYNPYVTNWLRHGHPLHPVYGPHSLDIGAQYRLGSLRGASQPEQVWMSVTGKSTAGPEDAQLKLPLTFSTKEWSAFRSPSVRIGGFGPWFSGGLLVALLALLGALGVWLLRRTARAPTATEAWTLLGVAGICLVATIVQPSAFLARFAPQLWFVAPLLAIGVVLLVGTRFVQAVAWIALGILLVDAVGVAGATVVWDKRDSDREAASLATLRRLSPLEANFSSWRLSEARRLRDAGIRFRTVDKVACKVPYILSVAGGLTRHQQLYGVPPPPGGVQLCPLTPAPPPTG